MSNIKIVYQRKVHKLPPKITTYLEIVESIKTLYPQVKQVHLYAIINPTDQNGVEEINCEIALAYLKLMYKQMGWPTIKLLVTENQNDENQLRNSIDLLNQSQIILDKSNYLSQPKTNKSTQQQQVIDYRKDEKFKKALEQIIDDRLRFYNLIQKSDKDDEYIIKAQKLSQVFTQFPYNWLLDFVKQQGEYASYELLAQLLSENQ